MRDPDEGVGADGTIVTGAARHRVPAAFEPVLAAAVAALGDDVELYLYGSVATGRARPPASDVDLLSVGLPGPAAAELGRLLSGRFADLCRGVEIGAAQPADLVGPADEPYGLRVFLRHYCVRLSGPPRPDPPAFPADVRAARGFNGDIAQHAQRWRQDLRAGADPAALARRVGRKSLLALASLVSVRDATWTTDRARAARRWSQVRPAMSGDLEVLLRWTDGADLPADPGRVQRMVEGAVARIVEDFATTVGLWRARPPDR
ncbi:nucleotidyltransferase domain-containing protein [Pseudonocardia kunmingensis]|uniref:nucleotidyltransferase domain-containing protein n=1 Tax=Pseudonocardia kunmingensis TaxID=630975 RepID=UPI0011522106|nr:nucleotidyltransferase domain-containing protein [Pseudonocardia kunmingensis]